MEPILGRTGTARKTLAGRAQRHLDRRRRDGLLGLDGRVLEKKLSNHADDGMHLAEYARAGEKNKLSDGAELKKNAVEYVDDMQKRTATRTDDDQTPTEQNGAENKDVVMRNVVGKT